MKNIAATALHYGYDKNHFYIVRNNSTEKFNHICSLHKDDFMKAYTIYLNNMEDIKFQLQDIYYFLQDRKLLNKFSNYASKHNIFKHKNHLNTYYNVMFFSSTVGFNTYPAYIKYSKLIPLFDEFKKDFKLI